MKGRRLPLASAAKRGVSSPDIVAAADTTPQEMTPRSKSDKGNVNGVAKSATLTAKENGDDDEETVIEDEKTGGDGDVDALSLVEETQTPRKTKPAKSDKISSPSLATNSAHKERSPKRARSKSSTVSTPRQKKTAPQPLQTPKQEQQSQQNNQVVTNLPSKLVAVYASKNQATISVFVDNKAFSPFDTLEDEKKTIKSFVGHDGNQYYCQVCKEFGSVICCDGCPRVYHRECIPLEDPSRKSLENDDDPWFCPECAKLPKSGRQRATSQQRCVDCHRRRNDLSLYPCEECGNYVHYPHCDGHTEEVGRTNNNKRVMCTTCQAVDELSQNSGSTTQLNSSARKRTAKELDASQHSVQNGSQADSDNGEDDGIDDAENDEDEGKVGKAKKRKKRRKKVKPVSDEPALQPEENIVEEEVEEAVDVTEDDASTNGIVQATPAFFFYLGENRWKIERVLARKHRYFNRLPKGNERNALVAEEAARWWMKLRPTDHKRYMAMSMRDYENQIIHWKEEKNIKDMFSLSPEVVEGTAADVENEVVEEEDHVQSDSHLISEVNNSVGSKTFVPEVKMSYNRVIVDLLHDSRFHPTPLFSGIGNNESKEDQGLSNEQVLKLTVPYFDVRGPISTCVGDECLGCSRGWAHFCPALKCRVPAVEHRARLQPPLSALLACRVGLGLRSREVAEQEQYNYAYNYNQTNNNLFQWKPSQEGHERNRLETIPSCTLSHPRDRSDDVMQFTEEIIAMKTPHLLSNVQKTLNENDEAAKPYHKCGRCRAIVLDGRGCIPCRRAHLVINMSKRQPTGGNKGDVPGMKVQTHMLGRVQYKELYEEQSASDRAISNGILKQWWSPNAILPPHTLRAPSPLPSTSSDSSDDDSCSNEMDNSSSSNSNMEVDGTTSVGSIDDTTKQTSNDTRSGSNTRSARATRSSAAVPLSRDSEDFAARQDMLQEYQREAQVVSKKALTVAYAGILLALIRRDPLKLFAEPVKAEGYTATIRHPMDFGQIRLNVLSGKYHSLSAFVADVKLLCDNALIYNPQGSIYWKTAKDIYDALITMQKRAVYWMKAIKDAHEGFVQRSETLKRASIRNGVDDDEKSDENSTPLSELESMWPSAIDMLESGDYLRKELQADLMRTSENEHSYYGCLAIRRASVAAETSTAPSIDCGGLRSSAVVRSHIHDEALRSHIDQQVSQVSKSVELRDVSTWREESMIRLLKNVQSRRIESRISSENDCARLEPLGCGKISKTTVPTNAYGRGRRQNDDDLPRIDPTRIKLSTGMSSAKAAERIARRLEDMQSHGTGSIYEASEEACVSVKGSRVHGLGAYADQPFKKGEIVAEYVGEYISPTEADIREKKYQEQRIQDYMFRINESIVIDATQRGGYARYINHNCSPNCTTKIVDGLAPREYQKRVLIIAHRDIQTGEELSYDYQFPLEVDLKRRIPCNCQSDTCRGFMNWDLPEKGSNNLSLLVTKRSANMRDRIRRLNRPLKKED